MDTIRADPLAGSYFSNRNKRPVTGDFRESPSKRARHRDSVDSDAEEPTITTIDPAQSAEDEIWEAAGTNAYESGQLKIDLGGRHLTKIPPQFILDLKSIVVLRDAPGLYDDENYPGRVSSAVKAGLTAGRRPFTRVYTAPATTSREVPRNFNDRSRSIANVAVMNSMRQDRAELFLSNNSISKLPLELWSLHNLAILALQNNGLTYLPPEIARLRNLRELNIANNRLKFVPSEMMNMELHQLRLFPNPQFLPEPDSRHLPRRAVSEIRHTSGAVPSLVELMLRKLLSPPSNDLSLDFGSGAREIPKTTLEQLYDLPLLSGNGWRPLSGLIRRILNACVRDCIAEDFAEKNRRSGEDQSQEITGVGVCANPQHDGVFLQHAEERFTWEGIIAGQSVGGPAPVRWRGCGRGCLSFLQETVGKSKDVDSVVQSVHFGTDELGFDE